MSNSVLFRQQQFKFLCACISGYIVVDTGHSVDSHLKGNSWRWE